MAYTHTITTTRPAGTPSWDEWVKSQNISILSAFTEAEGKTSVEEVLDSVRANVEAVPNRTIVTSESVDGLTITTTVTWESKARMLELTNPMVAENNRKYASTGGKNPLQYTFDLYKQAVNATETVTKSGT